MHRRRFLGLGLEAWAAGSILGPATLLGPTTSLGSTTFGTWAQSATGPMPGPVSGHPPGPAATATAPLLAVARGPSPAAITRAAVDAIGGMSHFVARGSRVVVKPNIGWDRTPEQAANTNPEVVAALVAMAVESGALSVLVIDNTCNDARRCYERSGIAAAARKAGAVVDFFEDDRAKKMRIGGERIKEWEVLPAIAEADVRINVPVAKHHGLAGVTAGMKNWLGAVGGPRGRMHQDIEMSVVDLAAFFRPSLTIVDGVRILTRGGPQGGDLAAVKTLDTVIASADPVAAEARAIMLLDRSPAEFSRIATAAARGLGRATWQPAEEKVIVSGRS